MQDVRLEALHHVTMITGDAQANVDFCVLFEIATASPGFAVDEDPKHLGEELRVPRMHESLRDQIEQSLSPLTTPAVRA